MKNVYLHQHLGLGDQIICNGLTRILCNKYNTIFLFVHEHNIENIKFMYRDLKYKIQFIEIKPYYDWTQQVFFVASFRKLFPLADHLMIGYSNLDESDKKFDIAFYEQLNLNFSKRFSDFYVERDLNREMNLFNNLNIKEHNYILINSVTSTTVTDINVKKYTQFKNYPIVNVQKLSNSELIFDWIYTCLNAAEIFSVDGGFKAMIDSFILTQPLYFNVREKNDLLYATSQNDWKLIE